MSVLQALLSAPEAFHNKLEIVKQTALQIVKDFELEGYEVEFSGDPLTAYDEMYRQIFEVVKYLLDKKIDRFMQLLYKIDISETQLKSVLHDGDAEQVYANVTQLILKRELQKVIIRNFYSGNLK